MLLTPKNCLEQFLKAILLEEDSSNLRLLLRIECNSLHF